MAVKGSPPSYLSSDDMSDAERDTPQQPMIEGEDFYLEDGFVVLTAHFLRERGWCCRNGCRHCPYGFTGLGKALEGDDRTPNGDPEQGRLF